MPHHEPVTILLVNDLGEEVKLVTQSFRGFFPGCRVDAVYSLDEALHWASRTDWHLILVDEGLAAQRSTPIFPELKRLAPHTTVVLQTDRSDATAAINTLQAGADFLLYKKSPAFLTELMLFTKGALEMRRVRMAFEATQERHGRLVDTLADVLYELDAEGRFVYLSPSITGLLGYAPEELTGAPYSTVVPPDQLDQARHRFNDRRTGARASRRVEVELAPKAARGGRAGSIRAELSAKGLYDSQRRYLGTLGLLRDISRRHELDERIRHLERQMRDSDRLVQMAQRLSGLSKLLQAPLAAVLSQSQQLLAAVQEARLDRHVESLLAHATEAVRQGEELAQTAREVTGQKQTLHDLLDAVLASTHPPLLNTDQVECRYAADPPPFEGNRDQTMQLFRTLLSHAQRYVSAVGSHHRLRIGTAAVDPTGMPIDTAPTLFQRPAPAGAVVHIDETESVVVHPGPPLEEATDLFHAYALVRELGGRLEFLAPAGGRLSITVWLPISPPSPLSDIAPPVPSMPSPAALSPVVPSPTPPAPPAEETAPSAKPPTPLPDRRRSPRISVHLPARITLGNSTREATVVALGLGGAGVVVEGRLPLLDEQPAYVVLKTAVGIVELQALAQDRGPVPADTTAGPPSSLLALRFSTPGDIEQKIVASLIEEAQDRTFSLTLEALLTVPEEVSDRTIDGLEPQARGRDHRESLRVRVALPARIDMPSLESSTQRPLALLVNVSRGGASLQMKTAPGAVGQTLSLHFSATGSLGHPRSHEPEAPEAVLTARIMWIAPDPTAPSELRPSPTEPGRRIGVRFVELTAFAEREINRVVAQHVGSSMDLEGIAGRSSIVSARRECRNARDQVIAVTDDHARHQISPATPVVIVVPGFGKTQTDYLPLAFFLAANRLRVLRYDHTNHVGQSDGDVLQTTLRSMQVDLQQVLAFARTTWPTAPLTIVAEDIGARVAVKVLSRHDASALVLLINPVLDVHAALTATYGHDVVADHQRGLRRGTANLWGLNVNLDQFLSDAAAGEYMTLASTVADWAALSTAPSIVTTPHPQEPPCADIASLLSVFGSRPVVVSVPSEVSHEALTFDERHRATFALLYKRISGFSQEHPAAEFREAPPRDLQWQQQLEQERIRIRHHVSQATRDALWIAHLAQLPQLGNLHDYWLLREELYRRLSPLDPHAAILDVGCGQGDVARVIQTNRAYAVAHRGGSPDLALRYIGLERSEESVAIARQYVTAFQREMESAFPPTMPLSALFQAQWMPFDWDSDLPFEVGSFERIVHHLSLSFSPSPLQGLRRALRLLSQDGILIMTSFQPHTDLSSLYRRHVRAVGQDEGAAPAQIVLHYLGRLREAIRHGLLHRYEREDLARLLAHAGAEPTIIHPVLDGQLLLAVAHKAKSPG